jgi:hypothetical protein
MVGAPGDGSLFLNSMKLWAMKQSGLIPEYKFDENGDVVNGPLYIYTVDKGNFKLVEQWKE